MKDHACDRRHFLRVATIGAGGISVAPQRVLADIAKPPLVPLHQDELCFMSAAELTSMIRSRRISAREVMAAHLTQIARVNPKVNAIVAKQRRIASDDAAQSIARAHAPVSGEV